MSESQEITKTKMNFRQNSIDQANDETNNLSFKAVNKRKANKRSKQNKNKKIRNTRRSLPPK